MFIVNVTNNLSFRPQQEVDHRKNNLMNQMNPTNRTLSPKNRGRTHVNTALDLQREERSEESNKKNKTGSKGKCQGKFKRKQWE